MGKTKMNIDDNNDFPYAHFTSRLNHENEMQQFSVNSRKYGLICLSFLFRFSLKDNQNDKCLLKMKFFGGEFCLQNEHSFCTDFSFTSATYILSYDFSKRNFLSSNIFFHTTIIYSRFCCMFWWC